MTRDDVRVSHSLAADARRAKLSSRLTKERNNLNDGFAV